MDKSTKELAHEFYKRAWDEEGNDNLNEAVSLMNKALALDPARSVYWATKGQFLMQLSDYDGAETAARKSVDLKPRNHHGWSLLGEIYSNMKAFDKAAQSFKAAVNLKPDYGTYTMLAAVEVECDLTSAVVHAKKALELNPDWFEAEKVLTKALRKKESE